MKQKRDAVSIMIVAASVAALLLPPLLLLAVLSDTIHMTETAAIVTVFIYDLFFLAATLVFRELRPLRTGQKRLLLVVNLVNAVIVIAILVFLILLVVSVAA